MMIAVCPQGRDPCDVLEALDKKRDAPRGMVRAKCMRCNAEFMGLSMGGGDLFWTISGSEEQASK